MVRRRRPFGYRGRPTGTGYYKKKRSDSRTRYGHVTQTRASSYYGSVKYVQSPNTGHWVVVPPGMSMNAFYGMTGWNPAIG